MQIFCDESGGKNDPSGIFLIASVNSDSIYARRVIKTFRKAIKAKDSEIKGSELTIEQRIKFFDILYENQDIKSSVIICDKTKKMGGWTFSEIPEHRIWSILISESIETLSTNSIKSTTVIPDGGRYKKEILRSEEKWIEDRVFEKIDTQYISVKCGDSQNIFGIQVADIISNTAFRSKNIDSKDQEECKNILIPLIASDKIFVSDITLEGIKPSWL